MPFLTRHENPWNFRWGLEEGPFKIKGIAVRRSWSEHYILKCRLPLKFHFTLIERGIDSNWTEYLYISLSLSLWMCILILVSDWDSPSWVHHRWRLNVTVPVWAVRRRIGSDPALYSKSRCLHAVHRGTTAVQPCGRCCTKQLFEAG